MSPKLKVLRPLKAIRQNCMECAGGVAKYITWCPCDGLHSTRCEFWPYRFGRRPSNAAQKYGRQLLTPELMPDASVCLDNLPAFPSQANGRSVQTVDVA
ncbi:MAG: hypothetical protein KJZ87_19740 [Thermoguttaceae bacterium]|nr:hypothetical protein [Thermoguttaceae bacterium]